MRKQEAKLSPFHHEQPSEAYINGAKFEMKINSVDHLMNSQSCLRLETKHQNSSDKFDDKKYKSDEIFCKFNNEFEIKKNFASSAT